MKDEIKRVHDLLTEYISNMEELYDDPDELLSDILTDVRNLQREIQRESKSLPRCKADARLLN